MKEQLNMASPPSSKIVHIRGRSPVLYLVARMCSQPNGTAMNMELLHKSIDQFNKSVVLPTGTVVVMEATTYKVSTMFSVSILMRTSNMLKFYSLFLALRIFPVYTL